MEGDENLGIQSEDYQEIIRKARKGDAQSFGELIKLHKEYLYRTAFLYMKNEDMALEVFQEAVVQGLVSIKTLKNPEYFRAWMTKILYNCAMEMYRKSSKTVSYDELEMNERNMAEGEFGLSREEKMDLHNAVNMLEEPYKSLVVQKYFEGLKIAEIAEQAQKPEGTVKCELSRARKQLRCILKEGYQYV